MRVCGVKSAGRAPVYNITVDTAHEYFAGGVLVSNCDAIRYLIMNHEKTYGLSTMDPVMPIKKHQTKSRFDDEDEDVKDEGYAKFDELYFVRWE